jgi:alkylation response protein AidB-like acyl-CoA dehydrogenase
MESAMLPATEEHRLIRESVATLAADFGHEYFAAQARAGLHADELWQAAAEAGFVGANLPEKFGGAGMGIAELSIVIEELAAHGCPLLMLVVSPAICGSIIAAHATAEQQATWLPEIASGRIRMSFAITEPNAGSNSHKITTTATRDGDGWRLNGTKCFITGVDNAAAILVVARTERDESTGRGRLSLFIVPTDAPGLSKSLIPVEIVAPERQFTLFFDDIALGPEALIGEANEGLRQVFTGLNPERITVAAVGNGIGRYALTKAADYARERKVWDVPIGAHQGLAHPLAEAYVQVELARLATWRAAELYDAGSDAGEAANIAKYAASEAALSALDRAIQTHGGNGLTTEFGLADLWFVARLLRTAPISREMILNFIAQHSLGLPKSY